MIRFDKLSPSPQPRFFVVYPGLKTLLIFCAAMHFPVSVTSIIILVLFSCIDKLIDPFLSMASRAFFSKFSITQSNKGGEILAEISVLALVSMEKDTFPEARFFM